MHDGAHRVIVIDDNPWIHEDVRKVLADRTEDPELARLEREMFGGPLTDEDRDRAAEVRFELDFARQGREGVEAARRAREDGRPYAIAFVDIRMPPGWDGIETIERLWEVDPNVQAVICSAYSDYSWSAIHRRLGGTDQLLVLKKPFEAVEIAQLAYTLARKWSLQRAERRRAEELEVLVLACMSELAATGQLAAGLAGEVERSTHGIGDSLQRLRAALAGIEPASRPTALEGMLGAAFDGLDGIARLVGAAKELGRGGHGERSAVDLNRALLATLEVARYEYGAVAKVETDLGDLPPVAGIGGELNLVLWSLIVNAARALGAGADGSGPAPRGTIRIRTWIEGSDVLLSIASVGPWRAIPRGDQRLAIASSVIGKHGGTLTADIEEGRGTHVTVRLPASDARPRPPSPTGSAAS